MRKYIILTHNNLGILEDLINQHFDQGYKLYRGLVESDVFYTQAMVLDVKKMSLEYKLKCASTRIDGQLKALVAAADFIKAWGEGDDESLPGKFEAYEKANKMFPNLHDGE